MISSCRRIRRPIFTPLSPPWLVGLGSPVHAALPLPSAEAARDAPRRRDRSCSLYQATVIDSRSVGEHGASLAVGSPQAGSKLVFVATAYCKGQTTASGRARPGGNRRRGPEGAAAGLGRPGRRLGRRRSVSRHLHGPRHGSGRSQGRDVDLYMWSCHGSAGVRPAADDVTVLRLGWRQTDTAKISRGGRSTRPLRGRAPHAPASDARARTLNPRIARRATAASDAGPRYARPLRVSDTATDRAGSRGRAAPAVPGACRLAQLALVQDQDPVHVLDRSTAGARSPARCGRPSARAARPGSAPRSRCRCSTSPRRAAESSARRPARGRTTAAVSARPTASRRARPPAPGIRPAAAR